MTIYFHQTGLSTWAATRGDTTVATITEIVEGQKYRVVYERTPGANKRNPRRTTRTLRGDLTHAQNRIQARGW